MFPLCTTVPPLNRDQTTLPEDIIADYIKKLGAEYVKGGNDIRVKSGISLFRTAPCSSLRGTDVDIDRRTAFGDTVLVEMFSPALTVAGNWLIGIGPIFVSLTAASDYIGQGKYQAGPAASEGHLSQVHSRGL